MDFYPYTLKEIQLSGHTVSDVTSVNAIAWCYNSVTFAPVARPITFDFAMFKSIMPFIEKDQYYLGCIVTDSLRINFNDGTWLELVNSPYDHETWQYKAPISSDGREVIDDEYLLRRLFKGNCRVFVSPDSSRIDPEQNISFGDTNPCTSSIKFPNFV